MEEKNKLIEETVNTLLVRYSKFSEEIASAKIEYRTDLKYHTAATDGKNVYLDPDYFASLNEEERLFILAHELMHKKFLHHKRLKIGGVKRDMDVWNEATDAIINANLQRDGFKIKEGYVNRPEALYYSADEFYEILLKEKQEQDNQKENQDRGENVSSTGSDHSLWEEKFENEEEMEEIPNDVDERKEFAENRQYRLEKAKEQYEKMKEENLKKQMNSLSSEKINLGNVGEENNAIDWKVLVRREFDKSEDIWSQRRSIAENNYAYRLEENEIEDDAVTEVLIDVSGSVNLDLVKSFLRMIKPLLRHSKLKVGCFNAKFWGMVEIKSSYDIDNFSIPAEARGSAAWTQDWDLAVRSFTKSCVKHND